MLVKVGDLVRAEGNEVKVVDKPEDFTIHDILLPLPGHQVLTYSRYLSSNNMDVVQT